MKIVTGTAFALVFAAPAFAQDVAIGAHITDELHGQYLAEAGALPCFTTEAEATVDKEKEASRIPPEGLEAQPSATTSRPGVVGNCARAGMACTIRFSLRMVVTNENSPLHHLNLDGIGHEPQGNVAESLGGGWQLVSTVTQGGDGGSAGLADVAAAESLYRSVCARCHGRTGRGQGSFPPVAGLDEDHIAARLNQYRAGTRIGPNSALMIPVASRLSDEEIASLAAFISTTFRD